MRIDPQKLLFSCTEAFCVGVAFAVGAAIVVSVLFGLLAFFWMSFIMALAAQADKILQAQFKVWAGLTRKNVMHHVRPARFLPVSCPESRHAVLTHAAVAH